MTNYIACGKAGMDHMHEVAVMQNVVETLQASMELAGASRVTNVQLALSTSGHFTEEAAHLSFQALTQDTAIEGATLTLSWLPAPYHACLASIALRAPHRRRHARTVAMSHWRSLTRMGVPFVRLRYSPQMHETEVTTHQRSSCWTA
jgi:Zn finger protein HypA/HybF involved in hydrogenase expression